MSVGASVQESTILTFLFTDIEGSTSKWEEQPEQMAQAVGRHDALLRDAVHQHQGRVVKTTGDCIYAAFAKPTEALASVIEIQLALLDPCFAINCRGRFAEGPRQRTAEGRGDVRVVYKHSDRADCFRDSGNIAGRELTFRARRRPCRLTTPARTCARPA